MSDLPVLPDAGAVAEPLDDIRAMLRTLTVQVTQLAIPAMGLGPPGCPVEPSSAVEPPPAGGTVHQVGTGHPGLVPDVSAVLRDVLVELRQLRVEVQSMRGVTPAKSPPLLLSRRAAAKLLGVCPRDTLPELLRCGAVKTVQVRGRIKIPLVEVERVAREGIESAATRKKRRPSMHEAPLQSDLWR